MNLSKGWALTLGVFLGFQVAKVHERLPFVIGSLQEIRDLMWAGSEAVSDDAEAESGDDGESEDA